MALNTIGNSGPPAAPMPATPVVQGGAPASAPKAQVAAVSEPPPQQQPSKEQVQQAVKSMKELVESKAPNSLSFSVDDSTGKTIVKISDAQTGEMIRQIPSEELLEIARSLDKMQGTLLRQEA